MKSVSLTHLSTADRKYISKQPLIYKINLAIVILRASLRVYPLSKLSLAWTGGKDSTLLLWLLRVAAHYEKTSLPQLMFIDEGDVFEEIDEFVEMMSIKWNLNVSREHNFDVSNQVHGLGDQIEVHHLSAQNQLELSKIGYSLPTFNYQPESFVGNHLMKTVPTNNWISQNNIQALITGVRWDEQPARAEDDFVRIQPDPLHHRIEPILHFTEKEIWQAIFAFNIPYVNLYQQGYRSLGAKSSTELVNDTPAWDQDLANTTERAGRAQDKEKIMKRLRDLGYM